MAGKVSKYLFDKRDFSDQAIEAEIKAKKTAPPPPPTFSERQLADARQAGFKEGFEQGAREEKTAREAHLTHVFDELKRQLDIVITAETVRGSRFEKESIEVAMAMVRHIFPNIISLCATDQLETDLGRIIEQNRDQEDIKICINPEMVEFVQKRFQALDNIVIESDPKLGLTDATLSWPNGGVVIDRNAMLSSIEALVSGMMHGREVPVATADTAKTETRQPEILEDKNNAESDNGDGVAQVDAESKPDDTG